MGSPPLHLSAPLPPRPPPAADHSWLSDSSPFLPIITVLAFVGIVIFLYALFAIKCPPNPFNRIRRSSRRLSARGLTLTHRRKNTDQFVSSVVYNKAGAAGNDSGGNGGGECPVCLTVFVEGEEIREVNVCKHLFHAACIDMWLCSHSNCPVCRACIGPKRSKQPPVVAGEGDFQHGLPDSASMV